MTWVKICGTTSLADAQRSVAAGADALGFIFAPSPRQIEVEAAAQIIAVLPREVEAIGVFVNEGPARVSEVAHQTGLTGVQLHGDEPAEQLAEYRRALGNRKIIKTLQARELLQDQTRLAAYRAAKQAIDAILLDSGSAARRGGTGVAFAWKEAVPLGEAIRDALPLIVAGGLNADNVAEVIDLFHPWGVDVVSGVESGSGTKDAAKLRDFVAAVRHAHASLEPR